MYELIEIREHEHGTQSQQNCFLLTAGAIKPGPGSANTVAQAVLDTTNVMYKGLRYMATTMFNALHNFPENSQLYSLEEEVLQNWLEVIKAAFEEGTVPQIFWNAPSLITYMLGVGRTMLLKGKWSSWMKKGDQ